MATRKKQEDKKTDKTSRQAVRFLVEPGKKVQITIDVGEKVVDGKVPLTVHIESVFDEEPLAAATLQEEPLQSEPLPVHVPVLPVRRLTSQLTSLKNSLQRYDLAKWLFLLALTVYLLTRLIGLTRFPIYFFTDEAIQSLSMLDLIQNGYRDSNGVWLPTYFRNGEYYNLSLSVYLQWLPVLLFGKSAVATRVTSVIVTLVAALSVGIVLRNIFKMKYWWTGTLFLSITPAWFLHSRTAFETVEFVALYAGTICAYLFYRYRSERFLYLTVFLGALAFYAYSPAQVIVPLTALGLLVSDWRFHWEKRRTVLTGIGLALLLSLPYIRSTILNPNVPFAHLHTLSSYWFEKIPLSEKLAHYFSEFGVGLSPWYWYVPNDRDLSRHLMKGYGNIMMATLPFALLGMAQAMRNLRLPAYRAILIALLVSPAAAALVQISITRTLVFVVPAAILTAIGLEQVLLWVENPKERLTVLNKGPRLTLLRVIAGLVIFITGLSIAFMLREDLNRLAVLALSLLLALQISGLLTMLTQSLSRLGDSTMAKRWQIPRAFLAVPAFLVLAGANILMLNDALRNGPLWFRDYGLGGMQYGAFQIFDIIEEYTGQHPDTKVIFSPDWANGADVVARFFLSDFSSIQIGSVRGHLVEKLPLDDNTLFILTPQEYDTLKESNKVSDIRTERILPYPDGSPGFYFIRLRYADNIDEIFAQENAVRQALQEAVLNLDGQEVKFRFSYLDSDFQDKSMALLFDNDPFTVAKTFESNPFRIEMTFPEPRTLNGFSIIIGATKVQLILKCYPAPGEQPIEYVFEGEGTRNEPELSFDLPEPVQVQVLQLEVLDPFSSERAKIHIWELKLR